MADGNPNGYSIISFDGREYRVDYKAAGRPANYQMQIHAPPEIALSELEAAFIYVNVFNGSERSKVQMQVNGQGDWLLMEQIRQPDPQFQQMAAAEKAIEGRKWRDLPRPMNSPHLWRAKLPPDLAAGVHRVEVRAADRHGRINRSTRIIRVVNASKSTP
jgi:hypothetical protein